MGFLGQFFGLLARAPLPGEPPADQLVLVVTKGHWSIERDGEVLASGPLIAATGLLAIGVADFCRVLGLRKREEEMLR